MNRCTSWHPTDYCTGGQLRWWRPLHWLPPQSLCPRHYTQTLQAGHDHE